jgi:predicted O-methyltransferase YrrM
MSDYRDQIINYITERFAKEDKVLATILENQLAGGGPQMNIGPDQGKLLELLVKIHKPRSILEVGSYYGYSSVWLARGLRSIIASEAKQSNIKLSCVEVSDKQCEILKQHFKLAELEGYIDVIQGSGVDIMGKFIKENKSFDMIFIDADKANYPKYLELSARLLPRGGLLLVDNTLWDGKVADPAITNDKQTNSIREFNDSLASSESFDSLIITIQDGLAIGIKR